MAYLDKLSHRWTKIMLYRYFLYTCNLRKLPKFSNIFWNFRIIHHVRI